MNCGKAEEPSSSRSQYPSTARFAATSAILTVILSRSDRAPSSSTVSARSGWDSDLNGCGCSVEAFRAAVSSQYFGLGLLLPGKAVEVAEKRFAIVRSSFGQMVNEGFDLFTTRIAQGRSSAVVCGIGIHET